MAYPPKPALPISNQHCLNAGRRGQRIYRLNVIAEARNTEAPRLSGSSTGEQLSDLSATMVGSCVSAFGIAAA